MQVLYTPYNNAPGLRCGFIRNCVYVGCMCVSRSVAVTCHLHIWQNGRDLAAVTRGWKGYPNKCQHRKFTLEKEKKKISRGSCRASNPTPFDHESVALPLSHSRSPSFSPSVLPRDDAMPKMTPPVALNLRPHDSVNVSLIGGIVGSHFTARTFHRHSRKAVRDATLDLGYGDSEHQFYPPPPPPPPPTIPRCEYHGRKK